MGLVLLSKPKQRLPVKSLTRPTDYTDQYGEHNQYGLYFRRTGAATWGSYWEYWNALITADHVLEETKGWTPKHPKSEKTRQLVSVPELKSPNGPIYLDAAVSLDIVLPDEPPVKPTKNMRVEVWGHPAACTGSPETRSGYIYGSRLEKGQTSYIIVFDEDQVPVSGGMSGGIVYQVLDCGSKIPLGITITLNSATNLDDDPELEDGMDFTSLYHVYAALKGLQTKYASPYVADELVIGTPPPADAIPEGTYELDDGTLAVDLGEYIFDDWTDTEFEVTENLWMPWTPPKST